MAKRRRKTRNPKLDRAVDVTTRPIPENFAPPNALKRLFNLSRQTNLIPVCVFLGLVVALVFLPVLGNGFVQWDDDITVYRNPHVQGLDIQRLHWMFTDVSYTMRYKPLSWLSIAVIHKVSGLKPFNYHLVSLLFHCGNAVLVFLVFRKLMGMKKEAAIGSPLLLSVFAALGALIWAVHPLRVEVVARVTDMTYCQSLFFVLISLWCYLRAVQIENVNGAWRKWYWSSVVAFGLAMGTYPFIFAYPAVLLVLDFYLLRRFGMNKAWWRHSNARRIWLEKLPFLLLSGLLLVTFYGRLNPSGIWENQELHDQFGWFARTMQAFYVWAYFVWKPLAPFDLSPVYTTLVSFDPSGWPFVTSALFVVGLTYLLFRKRRQWPLVWALWICHLLFLIPALGLTEHPHYASDRYSYVPGILWAALLAGGLLKACHRSKMCAWAIVIVIVLTTSLATMSARQTRTWHDTVTLFEYMIAKLGDNPYRADIHLRLGGHYLELGKLDDAIVQYRQIVPFMPKNSELHNNIGILLMKRGRLDEALLELREAASLNPQAASLRKNLGEVLNRQERFEEAIVEFQEAVRLTPSDAEAHNSLGLVLIKQGQLDKAINHFQEAVKLQPQDARARSNLDAALRAKNATSANSSKP